MLENTQNKTEISMKAEEKKNIPQKHLSWE